jgi:hypothetical protein
VVPLVRRRLDEAHRRGRAEFGAGAQITPSPRDLIGVELHRDMTTPAAVRMPAAITITWPESPTLISPAKFRRRSPAHTDVRRSRDNARRDQSAAAITSAKRSKARIRTKAAPSRQRRTRLRGADHRDSHTERRTSMDTTIPYPLWCQHPLGHEYDDESQAGEPQRHHERKVLAMPWRPSTSAIRAT